MPAPWDGGGGPAKVKPGTALGSPMGLLPFGPDLAGDRPEEWREVPIYDAIKRLAGPWVEEGFDLEVEGGGHVPDEGGGVVAANHASWFDPVFVGAAVDRPVHWMAKATLFRHPVLDAFFRRAGQIKVDRVSGGNQAAVDRSVELAREGRLSGIFPEGSRTIDGSLRRGRTGVARVALRSERPVIPLAVTSYSVLPKHAVLPDLDQPLVVKIGEPRTYDGMADRVGDPDVCRKVTDEVMDEIGRLLEQARTIRDQLAYEDE